MSNCSNGWPVLEADSPYLYTWEIPGTMRSFKLHRGSPGFILSVNALWYHETVERMNEPGLDDWGYCVRPIEGTNVYSNHSGGLAMDINATDHPYHVARDKTFSLGEINAIHKRLGFYDGCVRWGGDFNDPWVDGMHFEIVKDMGACEKVARKLMDTPRGKKILKANPTQEKVILS